MSDVSRKLNRLAQKVDSIEDGVTWFGKLEVDVRRAVLRELGTFVIQAHPDSSEVEAAVEQSGVRPSVTPAILLRGHRLRDSLAKVANLPVPELERGFRLLIALLGIADARRRRTECAEGCSHWWHQ